MRKASSTFSFRAPVALVAALACIVAIEAATGLWARRNEVSTTLQITSRQRQIDSQTADADLILLADSVATHIFDVRPLPASYLANLGVNGAVLSVGNYFLLKRYLERHKPPRAVVMVAFNPLGRSLDTPSARTWFQKSFLRWNEILEVSLDQRSISYALESLFYKIFATPHLRTLIQHELVGLQSDTMFFDGRPGAMTGKVDSISTFYFEKIIRLLEVRGIPFHFALTAMSPENYQQLQETLEFFANETTLSQMNAKFRELKTRHPNFHVYMGRPFLFPASKFAGLHLREEFEQEYRAPLVRYFESIVGTALAPTSRWRSSTSNKKR